MVFTFYQKKFSTKENAIQFVKARLAGKNAANQNKWAANGNAANRAPVELTAEQKLKWKKMKPKVLEIIAQAMRESNAAAAGPSGAGPSGAGPSKVNVKPACLMSNSCILRSKIPLRPYQTKVCQTIRRQRGLIVVHGTGTGKTLTAVTASQCYLKDKPGHGILVLTPKSVIENFKKTMEGYGLARNNSRYTIMSHESFISKRKLRMANNGRYAKPLIRDSFLTDKMLIIDEAHNFRNLLATAKDAQGKVHLTNAEYIRQAARLCDKVLCLTATPFVNHPSTPTEPPIDVYSLIKMVQTGDWDPADQSKWKNLFSFYERDMRDPNYPRVTYEDISITMSSEFFTEYEKIYSATLQKFQERYKNVNVTVNVSLSEKFYINIRQSVNGIKFRRGANMRMVVSPKVNWAVEKIKQIKAANGRVYIFSTFIDTGIERLIEELNIQRIEHNVISGEMTETQRKNAVNQYNNGTVPVLLITNAGGEGISLMQTTACIIFDHSWNPSREHQILSRGIRFKSHEGLPENKRTVNVYRLILDVPAGADIPSADKMLITKFIETKRQYIQAMMNKVKTLYAIERT
jgi:superfamily II DNA or RNA helicase